MKQKVRQGSHWKCTDGTTRRPRLGGLLIAAVLALAVVSGTPQPASANEPVVRFTPPSLVFGAQPVGQLSATLTARIENFGTASLTIPSVGINGADAGDFLLGGNSCGSPMSPGGSCAVGVAFKPRSAGVRSATLHIVDNTGSPHAMALSGTGTAPAVVLDPKSLAFPAQLPGTTSSPSDVTVTNSGDAPLNVSSVSINGENPSDFLVSGSTCGFTVGAGNACTISVAFRPSSSSLGTRSGNLTISDNAAGSPHVVLMTGIATGPVVVLSPASVDFGAQVVGATSDQILTISNTGDHWLTVTSMSLDGVNPGDFRISADACTAPAGGQCVVSVVFGPTAAGLRTAALVITHNAANNPHVVPLTGEGLAPPAPAVALTPTSLSFGDQMVGVSTHRTVTVNNTGNAPLNISRVDVAGMNPNDFPLKENACPAQVPAGANCAFTVAFGPTESGVRSATLVITDDAVDSPQSVALSGTGVILPKPLVSLTPTGLSFGDQAIGTMSGSQTVTVKNYGYETLNINSINIAGTSFGDFALTGPGNNCGPSLPAGAWCNISVAFKPTAAGELRAVVEIDHDADVGDRFVQLSGTGVAPPAPAVGVAPPSLSFGDQTVGSTSGSQTVTVTNTSNATLSISSVSLEGASAGDYVLISSTCGSAVPAAANCAITVAFRPTTVGARNASLVVADDAAGSAHAVPLTGTGVAVPQPQADLGVSIGATPNPVRTGTTLTYTITVSNFGPSTATGVVLTEQLPAESKFVSYKASNGSCTAPAPGATGTLTCQLGSLPVGSTSTNIVVKVVARGGTSVTNTATVTSTSNDPNVSNNSATVKTAVFGRK